MTDTNGRRRRRSRTTERMTDTAVAYLRVSTEEQADSGGGLDGQRAAIEAYAATRGWTVTAWYVDEGISGTVAPMERPELCKALETLRDGRTGVLLFHRPDRLARKAGDLLSLRDRADREGWLLASSDGAVDLTTPHGRMLFTMLGAMAEMERELISHRTREALAAKKAAGVRLGRPATLSPDVVERIVRERGDGRGWTAIATGLNDDSVPTAQGGAKWWPSAVQKVYNGQAASALTG